MADLPTIVITGATSGIGQLAAIDLARKGAHLVLTSRNAEKAEATLDKIESEAPGTRVDVYSCDFTKLETVEAAAKAIAEQHERIDVLINNAGIHAFEQRITVDGFSEMVTVNYLAPWLFTSILRERIVRSAPSRIVTVASEASRQSGGLTLSKDIYDKAPFTARGSSAVYGKTKLMDIMFSLELARQLEGTAVAVNCLDPGFNVTGLGRELGFAAPLEKILKFLNIGDPRRGAGIVVRLATDPAFGTTTGGYFSVKDAAPLVPRAPANDPQVRQVLWVLSDQILRRS